MSRQTTFVLGRFPPPLDGQTIASRQLADLIEDLGPVRRLDVSAPETDVAYGASFRLRRIAHYVGLRSLLRRALWPEPDATVLWTSISPAPLGHYRDWLATIPAFPPGQRIYAVVHHGDFHRVFERFLTQPFAPHLVKRLAGIVFTSRSLSERCAPWVPSEKRSVIPNSLLPARISTNEEVAQKQDTAPHPDLRLLFVSNMIPSKGYDDVLTAIRILYDRGLTARARFIGRWASRRDEQSFFQRVDLLGLRGVIEHLGTVRDDTRVKDCYLWADLFVLPTYYPTEAQPLVILEALSAGTPVVTTRQGGIPEILQDERAGVFVPPRAPGAIADAIVRISADRGRWLLHSDAARSRFLEAYSPDAVRHQWADLLSKARA